ncbi:hypothetical protein K227x_16140 [Rubripirellula lacrimiformis]|uniref:Uncharacterized protein n=1 Tax=Rubripirellula lacrimiformis TaxID=1930273 RepID=A0A517N7X9_9BACT|nr:hypothetical protein K227x_16140 [Rubripirellula lacrimiformis]
MRRGHFNHCPAATIRFRPLNGGALVRRDHNRTIPTVMQKQFFGQVQNECRFGVAARTDPSRWSPSRAQVPKMTPKRRSAAHVRGAVGERGDGRDRDGFWVWESECRPAAHRCGHRPVEISIAFRIRGVRSSLCCVTGHLSSPRPFRWLFRTVSWASLAVSSVDGLRRSAWRPVFMGGLVREM